MTGAPRFRLHSLGGLFLTREGEEPGEPLQQGGRPLLLLAWMSARAGRALSRATVAETFWPSADAERSRRSLRQALVSLRKLLGEDAFTSDREEVALRPGVLRDDRDLLVGPTITDIAPILEALRGPYLAGAELGASADVAQWVAAEREALRRRACAALAPRVATLLAQGRSSEALTVARVLARAHPEDAEAITPLIDALLANGGVTEASALMQEFEVLARTSGEPVPEAIRVRRKRLDAWPPPTAQPSDTLTSPSAALQGQLVGRDDDLATLMRAVEDARGGHPRRLLVHGTAGVGKTRLLDEIEARTRWRGARIARVTIVAAARAVPWSALSEVIRSLARLPGAAGVPGPIADLLVGLVPDLRTQMPGANPSEPAADRRRQAYGQAVGELLQAVAEDRLTVLMIDDAHNMDDDSRASLDVVTPAAGIRLVEIRSQRTATAIDGRHDGDGWTALDLQPFGETEVRTLLERAGVLPDARWIDAFVHALIRATQGRPAALQSALRQLESDGLLMVDHGTWTAAEPEALIAGVAGCAQPTEQLRGLSRTGHTVLLSLAYWNRPLDEAVLRRTAERLMASEAELPMRAALSELEGRGLAVVRDLSWAVGHDTIREALMAGRTPAEMRAVHSALLRAHVDRDALDLEAVERLALCAGSDDLLENAKELVVAASRARRVRWAGLYGDALVARVVGAAGRSEWGPTLRAAISWSSRRSPGALVRLGALAALVATAVLWVAAGLIPRLVVESPPMGERSADGEVRLVVQPRVGVFNGFGERLESVEVPVRVRAVVGRVEGDTIRAARAGLAQFTGLTLLEVNGTSAAERHPRDSMPVLEFDAGPWVRAVRIPVNGAWDARGMLPFRIVELEVNGQVTDPSSPLRVPSGTDSLRFILTFEYSTTSATANYIVAAAPTWLDHRAGAIRLAGLPRPVRKAWQTVVFTVPSPTQIGRHHIVLAMGAEGSADHLLSGTNWTLGEAIWDDGNDVADLPVSLLDSLRLTGRVWHPGYLIRGYDRPQGQHLVTSRRAVREGPAPQTAGLEVFGSAIVVAVEPSAPPD